MEGVVSGGGAVDAKYGVPIETCVILSVVACSC